ncbi:MAG: hypothetical protein WCE75_09780 [Terracidiphilus sp.]
MTELPQSTQSQEISETIREVGRQWAASSTRPRIPPDVRLHWDSLIDEWAESDLSLIIRKSGGVRGEEIRHPQRQRIIIADNSPATWFFTQAFRGELYTLATIKSLLKQDIIPFAFEVKSSEKARMKYKRTLKTAESLGKQGWKLCHIYPVGLNNRQPIGEIDISEIEQKFRLLLKPSNQFLVPLKWAGMGELPEVIDEVRLFEEGNSVSGRA